MQASDRVLAGRYAKALFLACVEKGEQSLLQSELATAHRLLADSLPLLRHPQVTAADKKKVLRDVLSGKVGALTFGFLELLIDKKRFDLLSLVGVIVVKLVADKNKTAKALVRTARPMSAEAQRKLVEKLQIFSGWSIELDVKEDPEIIGGLIVRLGDWVLDSSLRGQLKHMKETLNHGN